MAEGMMGRGPARRGRLSDEQRAQIRQVRMEQGRGAARAMRRDMRREAGLPVRQRQRQDGMGDFAPQPAPAAPQSPMVMGQPTGDMMAFRPMPVQQPGNMQGFDYRPLPPMPAGNPFPQGVAQGAAQAITGRPSMAPMSPGFGPGAAQGIGAALGGQANNPLRDQMLRFNEMSPETRARLIPSTENFFQNANVRDPGFQMTPEQMQAMRDQYTQAGGQPMPGMKPNFGPFPITDMMYRPSIHGTPEQMQQPMQQEPGYLGSIRRMMDTGRMDANHPAAQAVRGYDRQNMMNMFGQKQPQNQLAQGLAQSIGSSNYFI